ncbi:MAG: hypothetical protein AAF927_12100 [Bacteroidota bacterium]
MRNTIVLSLLAVICLSGFTLKLSESPLAIIELASCQDLKCLEEGLDGKYVFLDTSNTKYQTQYNYYLQSEMIEGTLIADPKTRLIFGVEENKSFSTVHLSTQDKQEYEAILEYLVDKGVSKTGTTDFGLFVEETYSLKKDMSLTISTRVYPAQAIDNDMQFNISLMKVH